MWRFEILIRYGGIYVDWDVIWLKPLAPELLTYEAVTSRDMYIPSGLPDNLNNGVLLAKKDAEFLHRCQESLRYYRTGCFVPQLCQTNVDWRFDAVLRLYNALFATYKVYECYPWTVLIEPHLQIMCFYGTCLPMWPRNSSEPIDWSDTYTQHFSDDPVEYSNSSLLASELERLENGDSVSFVVSNAAKVFKKARFSITQLRALG